MLRNLVQAPDAVVMIRPHAFYANPQTAGDNGFQTVVNMSREDMAKAALHEHNMAQDKLKTAGVQVHVFDDNGALDTPDSVFPNNWFSTHSGGQVAIYPMFSENRRRERRNDVIEMLKSEYRVQTVMDYSGLEADGLALEGTGAMVIDHIGRIAYTVRSNRADPVILERFCTHFNYEPIAFDAFDRQGKAIYHTNVLMCIATQFAMVGFEMIKDVGRRRVIAERLAEAGRELIDLSLEQIENFAGNAIELTGKDGRILAISERALSVLRPEQLRVIEKSTEIIPISIPTIENAGGSVRCMIAGIHLTKRI